MSPTIISIQSQVVVGHVGNSAAAFPMRALGVDVAEVPTTLLSNHPHYPTTRGRVLEASLVADLLRGVEERGLSERASIVVSGYLGSAEIAEEVAAFVVRARRANPRLLYLCDPVMGDHGKLYVGADTAAAICDCLVAQADILTPNRFEFGRLAGLDMPEARAAIAACDRLHAQTVLITSMPGMMRGNLGNLLICGGKAWMAEHRRLDHPPNGPGDLTAALLLSHLLDGAAPEEALRRVTASVFEIVAHAAGQRADELMLEADAGSIRQPRANVMVRSFG